MLGVLRSPIGRILTSTGTIIPVLMGLVFFGGEFLGVAEEVGVLIFLLAHRPLIISFTVVICS